MSSLVPCGWEDLTLGDAFSQFSSGMTPSRSRPEFFDGNILWVTSGELNYNIIKDTKEKITIEAVSETNLKTYPKGTFFIAITGLEAAGTRGRCAILGAEATVNQSCMAFISNDRVNTSFLFQYYMMHGEKFAFKFSQGTKQQSFNTSIVKILPLLLPPLPEQQKIAEILTSVDVVIEKIQAQIDKLKDLKIGMMQKLLTNGIGHTEFKNSSVGRVPVEWEVVTFFSVLNKIDSGWSPRCTEVPPRTGKWGVLKVSAVTRGEFLEIQSKELPSTLEPRHHIQVKKGNILLTRANGVAALVGKCVMVREEPKRKLMMSDKILRLNPNNSIDPEFLLHSFNSEQTRKQIELSWGGTSGQKNISQADIKLYKLALPPIEEQKKISQFISQVEHTLKAKDKKLCSLLGVKKALMQDLLTGKVRVKVDS